MRARFAGGYIDRRVIAEWPNLRVRTSGRTRAAGGKIVTCRPDAEDQPPGKQDSRGFDRYRLVAETPDDALYQFVDWA